MGKLYNPKVEEIFCETIEEFNSKVDYAKKGTKLVLLVKEDMSYTTQIFSQIVDKPSRTTLLTAFQTDRTAGKLKTVRYVFNKLDTRRRQVVAGSEAYRLFQLHHKVIDLSEDDYFKGVLGIVKDEKTGKEKFKSSAKPLLGFKPQYDNAEHYVWVYDLNSAYANVLKDKVIDDSRPDFNREVKENEVGFFYDANLTMVHSGLADIIFPLIDSPYKKWVNRYWDMKKNPGHYVGDREAFKDKKFVKDYAKQVMNYAVGCTQNHNPFFRAYIVNTCNENIRKYIDKDTIMWNTDSIVSLAKRDDLQIGDGIGQFKIEYEGLFRHKRNNYQSPNNEKTSLRGYCYALLPDDFNLLEECELLTPSFNFNKETYHIEWGKKDV